MSKKTKKVYVPRQQDEMPGYVSNANEKLTTGGLGAKYGLTAGDLDTASGYATNIPNIINQAETAEASVQSLNKQKSDLIYEATSFYREMGHAWQKSAVYDAADMEAMGFFKIETPADPNLAKPIISRTTILPDQVIMDWVKAGWGGVYIDSMVEELSSNPVPGTPPSMPGSTWQRLGEDEKSPFEDTRKNRTNRPEIRYYRMRYKQDNKPIGLYSEIVKVIVEIY
jgi:hypothetical protein